MVNPLVYIPTAIPSDGVMNFSPSQFAKFIQSPHIWYRSEVLREEGFTHSTSTVLGTCVHYCAEQVAKGEIVDKTAVAEYIDSLEINDQYEPLVVHAHWVAMAECLVNDYVLENQYLEIETTHQCPVRDGYFAGGKLDALQGSMEDCIVTDYKTYHSKTAPKAFPSNYRYQLMVYAWILRQQGYNPTRLRLVYVNRHIEGEISEKTGKQLKSYPPQVTVLTESFTEEGYDFIQSLLELAVDSVEAAKTYPELCHVIFHDPRLRP